MPDLPTSAILPNPATDPALPADSHEQSVPQRPNPGAAPATADLADDAARPDIASDEVGFRPPDRLPSEDAPASENAALIFERS